MVATHAAGFIAATRRPTRSAERIRATIVARQLRALAVVGFDTEFLAGYLGYATTTVDGWRRGDVWASELAADDVDTAFDRLADTLPSGPGAARTVALAREREWAGPDEWVDIRDPDDRPDSEFRRARRRGAPAACTDDDVADLAVLGWSDARIAYRYGVQPASITRRRRRAEQAALAAEQPDREIAADNAVTGPGSGPLTSVRHLPDGQPAVPPSGATREERAA